MEAGGVARNSDLVMATRTRVAILLLMACLWRHFAQNRLYLLICWSQKHKPHISKNLVNQLYHHTKCENSETRGLAARVQKPFIFYLFLFIFFSLFFIDFFVEPKAFERLGLESCNLVCE